MQARKERPCARKRGEDYVLLILSPAGSLPKGPLLKSLAFASASLRAKEAEKQAARAKEAEREAARAKEAEAI